MTFEETILAALVPKTPLEKEIVDQAYRDAVKAGLKSEYFTGQYRFLWDCISKQVLRESPLDSEIIESELRQSSLGEEANASIRILFASCREQVVSPDKLESIIPGFIESKNTLEFGAALEESVKILTDGARIGKVDYKGLQDSKDYLLAKLSGMRPGNQRSPECEIKDGMAEFWERFRDSRDNPKFQIKTGINEIDRCIGGIRRKELFTFAAYTKHGKSQFLRSVAYNAAIRQGINTVFVTFEMGLEEVMNLFVSIHSTHEKFGDVRGVPVNVISEPKLIAPRQEEALKVITEDLEYNEHYGRLHILQLPSRAKVGTLTERLFYLQNSFNVDFLVLDYASLLMPDYRSGNTTQELTTVFQRVKDLAQTFNGGAGLPILTAHQTSTSSLEKAMKKEDPRYDIGFCSDAIEVVRSSDAIVWGLRTPELVASREIKMGVSQFRRGPLCADFKAIEYFDCSLVRTMDAATGDPGEYEF